MDFKIRNATKSDFIGVYNLLKQLWSDLDLDSNNQALNEIYLKAVDSGVQRLIVGEIENKIVGFCSLTIKNNLWQVGNLGHVDELVVDKNFRGNGYGIALIDSITQIAKDLKCKRIELDSAFHRKEAHRFYESLEYENRAYLFSKQVD